MGRLLNKEVEKRLVVKLDKSIKDDTSSGIMSFGADNDYPQVIEKLIFGSETAKAASEILAKFIGGDGFENAAIGAIEVGKDKKGKPVTLDNIRRQVAKSLAKFNGVYIHCNLTLDRKVKNTKIIPFKYCRLSREDDAGFCARIAVHPNWSKESEGKKFDKKDISWLNHFNLSEFVFNSQVNEETIANFKGQVYSLYLDDDYLYPLSPFDSVYLDMDTEYQIQLFKNREIREGMSDKLVFHITANDDEKEQADTVEKIKKFGGPDGEKTLVFEDEFDENGDLKKDGSVKVDQIKTNINDKLFDGWEKSIPNNIRKAAKGLPAVLIDYEMGTLGSASGEMIIQAVEYYNAVTKTLRESVSDLFKDIYSHFDNETLKNNDNWNLKDVSLINTEVKDDALNEKVKAQAVLRGSVGGITSLIALQQSVSEGKTTIDSAIAIVQEIYGISPEIAKAMIGEPKLSNPINYTP